MNENKKRKLEQLETALADAYQKQSQASLPGEKWKQEVMREIRQQPLYGVAPDESGWQWPGRLVWQTAFATCSLAIVSVTYAAATDLSFDLYAFQTFLGESSMDQLIRLVVLL